MWPRPAPAMRPRQRRCPSAGIASGSGRDSPAMAVPWSPSCPRPAAALSQHCATSTLVRPARRGLHHEGMWLTSDEPALSPTIAKAMSTLSLDHRIDPQNLTDISAGVKLVVREKQTGAAGAPVEA